MGGKLLLPAAALVKREFLRAWRERSRMIGIVASPLLFWVVVGSGFGNMGRFYGGALLLTVMFSSVFSMMSLIDDRKDGFLLGVLVSPAPRASIVLGKVLGAALLSWAQGLIFLVFLPLTGFRASKAGIVGVALLLLLVALEFTALGFLFAWRLKSAQGFHAILNLVMVPLWMTGGALFAPASAHGWMQVLMKVNPLLYAQGAMERLLDAPGAEQWPALGASVWVCATVAAALIGAAVWMARENPDAAA